jgi:hypothetical protein
MSSPKPKPSAVPPPQVLCPSITSRELEGSLDPFLQKYHDNGHDREHGALLVKNLPISKYTHLRYIFPQILSNALQSPKIW